MEHREADEFLYWRNEFQNYKQGSNPWYDSLLSKDSEVSAVISTAIQDSPCKNQNNIKVLDVGCGPLSVVGKKGSGYTVDVIGVDPMADMYKQILSECGVEQPFESLRGFGETLDEMFEVETFDFVHSRNALDHCQDAPKVLKNMINLLKDDCKLHFTVYQNEGEKSGYSGFHTWNFDEFNKRICVWTPEEAHFLDNILEGYPYTFTKKHIGEHPEHPYEFSVQVSKVTRDLSKYQEICKGVYALVSKGGWVVLHCTRDIDTQYDCFIHAYDENGTVENLTFRWYSKIKWRFLRIPSNNTTSLTIGQFKPIF